jgi:hypothetical protein
MIPKIIYLCAPYSSNDKSVILERVYLVNKKAAELMDEEYIVFSPISHSHEISAFTKTDALDHDFWLRQDLPFMAVCDEVWIYRLPGWEHSRGIKTEMEHAEKLGKVIRWI